MRRRARILARLPRSALLVPIALLLMRHAALGAQESGSPAAAATELTPSEIDAVVAVLENEAARADVIAKLRALRDERAAKRPGPGIGARIMAAASDRMADLGARLLGAAAWASEPRAALDWLEAQTRDPERRRFWSYSLLTVAVVLLAGLASRGIVRAILAGARRRIEAREIPNQLVRIRLLIFRAVLDVLAVVGFGAAAYGVLFVMRPSPAVRLLALAVVDAVVVSRSVLVLARLVMTPLAPRLRLIRLSDAEAAYAYVWTSRFVYVVVYGYFLTESAVLLGVSPAGRDAILDVVGLVVAAMTFVLVLQLRERVATVIRGPRRGSGRGRVARQWLGDTWHVVAGLYVLATYLVWALDVPGGFAFILRGTAITLLAVAVAQVLLRLVRRGVRRLFRIAPELSERFPDLQDRVDRYEPVVRLVLGAVIAGVAALVSLEAWGVHAAGLLASDTGRELLSRLARIAVILALAAVAWELTRILVARYLGDEANGNGRSQRVRTLLPLARSALLVLIAAMATMSVLAEMGVNIGPLLAGAGIVGLAVGFGAQTLVKDVINGAFILMEDTIAVGDIVELDGHRGKVEAISIRSVRHRDLAGTVHTVPFSSVDVVRNYTKHYSYYLTDVGVAYRENTDEVVAVIREVVDGMRVDEHYGPSILEPIDVMGVNEFADSAVLIRTRIKTRPGEQWRVGREFNRRLKHAFDERGIEIPFPHRTVYFGVDKEGGAPPARLRVEKDESEGS